MAGSGKNRCSVRFSSRAEARSRPNGRRASRRIGAPPSRRGPCILCTRSGCNSRSSSLRRRGIRQGEGRSCERLDADEQSPRLCRRRRGARTEVCPYGGCDGAHRHPECALSRPAKAQRPAIPWCTYTDPAIAHVGIYVREARERGIPVKTFTVPMSEVDRAVTDGEEGGFAKIHVRDGTDTILGATIVARHAGEMINEITLAMVAGIGLRTISRVIHSYPTQAEAIRQAADAYPRARPTPFLKELATRWLAWSR